MYKQTITFVLVVCVIASCFIIVDAGKIKRKRRPLITKTIEKPSYCKGKVEQGDIINIFYHLEVKGERKKSMLEDIMIIGGKHKMGTIKGIEQGVLGMCVGEKRKMKIRSSLAFGEEGHEEYKIGPNQTITTEVLLLDINKKFKDRFGADDDEGDDVNLERFQKQAAM